MIFTRLTITNFGVYRGHNEFDLRPRQHNGNTTPIVLVEGQNGAGKTTFLETVRLCLYGIGALGSRVRRTDYEAFIKQRAHRGDQPSGKITVEIGLIFEHTHVGVRSIYDAVRSWHIEDNQVREMVSLFKDGKAFTEVAEEHWNDFLRDLIPPGVANLFFFDGEQIQALADDETSTGALETAIRGLLNLELIERLRADLSNYLRQKQLQDRSRLEQMLEQERKAEEAAEQYCGECQQDLAGLKSRMDYLATKLEKTRDKLLREGASFIHRRDELQQRQQTILDEMEITNTAIRDLATGLLPFAVAPVWCRYLRQRLQDEATAEQARIAYETQCDLASNLALSLLNTDFQQQTAPAVSQQDWARIATKVQQLVQPDTAPQTLEIRHPLSAQDRTTLLQWIDVVIEEIPQQLHTLTRTLETLETEQSKHSQSLVQMPEDVVAVPLINEFNRLSEQKGQLQAKIDQFEEKVRQAKQQRAECERKVKNIQQKLALSEQVEQRVALAAKVQLLLDDYLKEMKSIKIEELAYEVARFFNLLSHKQTLVREVHIDPETYQVKLYGSNRIPIETSELSAGEKQLYAMSLLWALRSVSGRAFPIIVDTPMGRLDSAHRQAMLTRFFPQAAHQVILLATDTEVDKSALATLQPALSHRYHLWFDKEHQCTHVQSVAANDVADDRIETNATHTSPQPA